MPRCRLYYHVVFATEGRQPLLTPALRQEACRLLREKAIAMGCAVHAINAQPDHVHLALSIPPVQPVAKVIGQLKGSSSHALNQTAPREAPFGWQSSYGVFTFGERSLSEVVRYVANQDERHARAATVSLYEPDETEA